MRSVLVVTVFLLLISSLMLKTQTAKIDQEAENVKSITKELCASLYYTIDDYRKCVDK